MNIVHQAREFSALTPLIGGAQATPERALEPEGLNSPDKLKSAVAVSHPLE
jgi:hypothetical protein